MTSSAEAHQRLLLQLLHSQRQTQDDEAMMATAAEALARHLGANRAGFFELVDDRTCRFGPCWTDGRLPLSVGRWAVARIGSRHVLKMRRGEAVGIADTRSDPLTADGDFAKIGALAVISAPIVRGGKWHAGLFVNHAEPRQWSAAEVGLVREIANLTWDAVERARAVEALRDNEERLRLATEAAEIGLWDVDAQTGTLFWPERVKAALGLAPDKPVSLIDFYGALHPDDALRVGQAFAAALDPHNRPLYEVEYRVKDGTGGWRWIAAKGRALFDERGVCRRVVGVALDVSLRKEQEQRLRQLNELLARRVSKAKAQRKVMADIVEASDTFVQVIDPQYRWLAINRAAANEFDKLFGLKPQPGETIHEALASQPQHIAMIEPHWRRCLAGEPFDITVTVHSAAGEERYYDMRFSPLRGRRGEIVGAYQFCVDVTERLRDQRRLAEAQEHLRQVQKMEAIGQLTGGVAHDFNNLLMVVSGGLSLFERSADEARRKMVVEAMRDAVQRGAALSRQLLGFARRRALNPEPVDLAQRIRGMQALLDRSLRGDVKVATDFPAGLWPARVDPAEFELAVLNLCVNARDAMPSGGTITVSAANVSDPARVGLSGDFVRMAVTDTGVGMDREVLARVFEPFFTTKDVGKGSGLGLPQVYGFAQQSGGAVEIDSTPGKGTVASLFLPRSMQAPQAAVAPAAAKARTMAAEPASQGAVLLVEDDDEVAALVGEMLQQLGYQVTRAASAQAALGALANGRPVDVVFSDVMMPGGMSGVELAREIRKRRPGLPVLLTSGYADLARRDGELADVELLAKPYTLEHLAASLARTRSGSRAA